MEGLPEAIAQLNIVNITTPSSMPYMRRRPYVLTNVSRDVHVWCKTVRTRPAIRTVSFRLLFQRL